MEQGPKHPGSRIAFLARGGLRIPISVRRYRLQVAFGAGVGDRRARRQRDALLLGQEFRKLAEDAGRHGNVAGGDVDAGRRRKRAHDGQKRSRGKCRCLISQRIDNGGGRCAHRQASLCVGVQVPMGALAACAGAERASAVI